MPVRERQASSGLEMPLPWPRIAAILLRIICGILYGIWSCQGYTARYGALDASGVETEATILSKHTGKAGNIRSPVRYRMRVGFSAGDRRHRGFVPVTRGFYNRHDPPDRVPIRYLPEDPQVRELDPALRGRSVRKTIAIIAVLLFVGLANAFLEVGNEDRKQRRENGKGEET